MTNIEAIHQLLYSNEKANVELAIQLMAGQSIPYEDDLLELFHIYGIRDISETRNMDTITSMLSNATLHLAFSSLTKIPKIVAKLNFKNYDFSHNDLTDLENSPLIVKGNYDVYKNKLTSLNGCPKHVGNTLNLRNNELTNLEGCAEYIGCGLEVEHNKLITLKGCTQDLSSAMFMCQDNQLMSLEYGPKKVYSFYYCGDNPGKFNREYVQTMCDVRDTTNIICDY